MIWDGARSVIVRTDRMDAFNASAPAFLDISEKEKAKFLKGLPAEPAAEAPPPARAIPAVASPSGASPA
jgi:hypothetical protein